MFVVIIVTVFLSTLVYFANNTHNWRKPFIAGYVERNNEVEGVIE
jgi:hypothetical protein